MQLLMIGLQPLSQPIAPLCAVPVFPLMVQLVMVGEEALLQKIPPPRYAEFPLMVQLVIVGEEK